MKRTILLLAMLTAAGCSTAPVSFSGLTSRGPSDGYSCALQQLNAMGYTVEDADRDAGFIRGRKQTSGLGTAILTGSNYHDVLTVAVFQDPTTRETTIRATSARVEEKALGIFGGNERGIAPSDDGKAEASRLLRMCGVEAVPAG